jgi:hypothetical protein
MDCRTWFEFVGLAAVETLSNSPASISLLPKSCVNQNVFSYIWPKIQHLSSQCLHQSLDFQKSSSPLQGFYSMNPIEYLIRPLLNDGRVDEPQSRSVLRAGKFARQPEESVPELAQGQAMP